MASILDELESELDELNSSLWIKENDIYRPSTNLKILTELEPGVYTVDYDRDLGYFCKKLPPISDELFLFSNSIISELLSEIDLFWEKKDLFKENKLIHKRGILLTGFPGTGKSSIVTQISQGIIDKGGVVFIIQNLRNLDFYFGFLKVGFRRIQPDTPLVTIIEDIEKYGEVETELLDFLDGKSSIEHHIVISTSNNTDDLPDSLLRSSRFDIQIEVELPDERVRREYFTHKNVPSELLDELVERSDECSLADLKEIYVCIFLLEYSIKEAFEKVLNPKERKNYLFKGSSSKKIGL
jgi:SpoVK/Ycf46/Vps4 family AAA+-type ATPase